MTKNDDATARRTAEVEALRRQRDHIAAAIRALPFAGDEQRRCRQGWMRERAACLAEGSTAPTWDEWYVAWVRGEEVPLGPDVKHALESVAPALKAEGLTVRAREFKVATEEESERAFGGAGTTLMRKRREPVVAETLRSLRAEEQKDAMLADAIAVGERPGVLSMGTTPGEMTTRDQVLDDYRKALTQVVQEREAVQADLTRAQAQLARMPPPEALARLVANVDRLVAELDDERRYEAEGDDDQERVQAAEAELAATRGLLREVQAERDKLHETLHADPSRLLRELTEQLAEARASRELFRNALVAAGYIPPPRRTTAPHDADEAPPTLSRDEARLLGVPLKVDPKLPPGEAHLGDVRITNIGPAHDDDDGEAE